MEIKKISYSDLYLRAKWNSNRNSVCVQPVPGPSCNTDPEERIRNVHAIPKPTWTNLNKTRYFCSPNPSPIPIEITFIFKVNTYSK